MALARPWGEARGGVLDSRRVSALEQSRQQRAGEVLAVLHPPLVETVQIPDDAFGEHFVLVQRDECAERARSEALEKHGARRAISGEGLVRRVRRGVAEGKGCALAHRLPHTATLLGGRFLVSS